MQETMDKSNVGGLDFNKGFTYQDQDLSNVHNSPEDIKSLNDEKLSKFLGKDISAENLNKREVKSYVKGLTTEQKQWIKDNSSNFSTYGLMAYVDNWDKWQDPFATGTGMFEMKSQGKVMPQSVKTGLIGGGSVVGGLGTLEGVGRLMVKSGEKQYQKYVRPTQRDAENMIKDAGNAGVYDNVNKALEEQMAKIENMKSAGASAEEIAKEQAVYDQMKKSGERYNLEPRKSSVEWAMENDIKGSEQEMASQGYEKARTNWITEVEPEMVKSDFTIKRSDVLKSITKEDLGVTDYAWETQYKPELEKMIAFEENSPDAKLIDLQEWRNKIQTSKQFNADGTPVKSVGQNIDDHLDRKLGEIIGDQLEKEHPGQGFKQKVADYGLGKDFTKTHTKKATTELTKAADKKNPVLEKRVQHKISKIWDKITGSNDISRQTKRAERKIKWGTAMQPSTWLKKLKPVFQKAGVSEEVIDATIDTVSKSEKIAGMAAPKVLRGTLRVFSEMLPALDALSSVQFIEDNADIYSVIPLLYEKLDWKNGKASNDFEGWSEKDWEKIGLGENDIGELIMSDGWNRVANRVQRNGDDFTMRFLPLTANNYDPIINLGE